MYTLHPPPIVHNGNVVPKPFLPNGIRPFQNGTKPFQDGNFNVVPKPFCNGTLPRNFTANRHSMNSSSTLPRNFNLNLNKRCSMPVNSASVPANNCYNLLHNVVRQRQQEFEQKQQQLKQQQQFEPKKHNHQQQRVNEALNHRVKRKVRAVGDENGFVVTIPASDKPTQLFVRIPPGGVPAEKTIEKEEIPDFIVNSQSQIRRKSKAHNARLQEGDEIVAVNGRNCQNLSRDVTMSYVDGAKESLDLEVIRRDRNFNTVNASTYNITSNNNAAITTGKPATIQLVPSGSFQPPPGRPASVGGTVRQTTNVQTHRIPVQQPQTQGQRTITRTVTTRVGDGPEKTSTTREVKHFGGQGQETTTAVINTGQHQQHQQQQQQHQPKQVIFQPKPVSNTKPSGWSPSPQPQQQHRQPESVKVGQRTTIHLQGSFDDEPAKLQQPGGNGGVNLADLIPSQTTRQPAASLRPTLAKPQSISPMVSPKHSPKPKEEPPKWQPPAWYPPAPQQQQQQQREQPVQPTWQPQQHQAPKWQPPQQREQPVQPTWQPPQQQAPKWQPLKPSHTWQPPSTQQMTPQEELSKRWSAPAAPINTNVGKEMTITFGGPQQTMRIPIGVAAPMSMGAPAEETTTVTKYSTRTVTMLEETAISGSSDEEEPDGMTMTTTTIQTTTSSVPEPPKPPRLPGEPVDIMEDPSIILRGGFKPKDAKKVKMLRPKSFPGAAMVEEIDLDETDKMKVCKTIADLLMFPKNKQAKGAKMFAKRRKRSAKYTIEAYGVRGEDEELPTQIGPHVPEHHKQPAPEDGVFRSPTKAVPPPPPPPPPPTNEPIFIPHLGICIEPTDFTITKKKEKCDHKTVTPQQCGMLVADLKGASGRGASMFERRRKRSEKFVLTNEGKVPSASPDKENEPPKTVTLEFIARHGGPEEEEAPEPAQPVPPVNLHRKTPWEAAMDSPIGSIDSAFNSVPKKKGFTGVDSGAAHDRPKPPAEWMKTSSMLPHVPAKPPVEPKIKPKFRAFGPTTPDTNGHAPEPMFKLKFDAKKQDSANYKDFNKRARGWGGSPHNSPGSGGTPPSASPSPASVHSGEFAGSQGLAASFPTQPLKYSGGYNNFNANPRNFAAGGAEDMESDDL